MLKYTLPVLATAVTTLAFAAPTLADDAMAVAAASPTLPTMPAISGTLPVMPVAPDAITPTIGMPAMAPSMDTGATPEGLPMDMPGAGDTGMGNGMASPMGDAPADMSGGTDGDNEDAPSTLGK